MVGVAHELGWRVLRSNATFRWRREPPRKRSVALGTTATLEDGRTLRTRRPSLQYCKGSSHDWVLRQPTTREGARDFPRLKREVNIT